MNASLENEIKYEIFQAGFNLKKWIGVLRRLSKQIGANYGYIYTTFSEGINSNIEDVPEAFIHWRRGEKFMELVNWYVETYPMNGFESEKTYSKHLENLPKFRQDLIEAAQHFLQLAIGDRQVHDVVAIAKLPLGGAVVIGFDRFDQQLPFGEAELEILNSHFADIISSLNISNHLSEVRVNDVLGLIDGMGFPCAMMKQSGDVLAASKKMLKERFVVERLKDRYVFESELLKTLKRHNHDSGISVAMQSTRRDAPNYTNFVLHTLPIVFDQVDIWLSKCVLVYLTSKEAVSLEAEIEKIMQVFSLTKREAELAAHLSNALSLSDCAKKMKISLGTARAYLHKVFSKTATTQQSALVAKILRIHPIFAPQK